MELTRRPVIGGLAATGLTSARGMTRRAAMELLAGLASSWLLAGCYAFSQQSSFRVRMTVEVQTAQGVKTGLSVMEMAANSRIAAGTQSTARFSAGLSHGEAVMVDLPGGPVFVLLAMPDSSSDFAGPIFDALNGDNKPLTNDHIMSFVQKMGAAGAHYQGELPHDRWPMMVRFRDIGDPKTIERIQPEAIGVRRISVETTDDKTTNVIAKTLTWLGRIHGDYLDGSSIGNAQNQGMNGRYFTTEIN